MSTPQMPPFDTGNPLLGQTPASLSCALLETPAGQRLALTIRTASTTVTVLLDKEDGQEWGRSVLSTVNQMSSAGLILAPAGAMPAANGNGAAK